MNSGSKEKNKGLEECLAELSSANSEVVRTALSGGQTSELGNYSGDLFFDRRSCLNTKPASQIR